jgi:hypothetical protein
MDARNALAEWIEAVADTWRDRQGDGKSPENRRHIESAEIADSLANHIRQLPESDQRIKYLQSFQGQDWLYKADGSLISGERAAGMLWERVQRLRRQGEPTAHSRDQAVADLVRALVDEKGPGRPR